MSNMEYIILASRKSEELSDLVTEYLNKGWQLYGPPFSDQHYWSQAVIKITVEKPEFVPPSIDIP